MVREGRVVLWFGAWIVYTIKFDRRKAIEAAAILAKGSPAQRLSRKRLLALLYFANRKCLKKSGRPLVGGRLVAMQYGPIHGDVYDLFNEKEGKEKRDPDGAAEWSRHFHNEDYYVVLDEDPGVNALSRSEVKILTETLQDYEEEDDFDIARQTHRLNEYVFAYQKGKARTITLEQLLYAVASPSVAEDIMAELKEKDAIDELFDNAKPPTRKKR